MQVYSIHHHLLSRNRYIKCAMWIPNHHLITPRCPPYEKSIMNLSNAYFVLLLLLPNIVATLTYFLWVLSRVLATAVILAGTLGKADVTTFPLTVRGCNLVPQVCREWRRWYCFALRLLLPLNCLLLTPGITPPPFSSAGLPTSIPWRVLEGSIDETSSAIDPLHMSLVLAGATHLRGSE